MHVVIIIIMHLMHCARGRAVVDTMSMSYHCEFHFFINGGVLGTGLQVLRGVTASDLNF